MANDVVCRTRLVGDVPAHEDSLAYHVGTGAHQRVSDAIADLIVSPEESGGKVLGLEGGWGSGKTTVINLVRKRLMRDDDVEIFSFDAWAHEGDPLRRTYLEALIRQFRQIGWVEKGPWSKTLEGLAKRRKVSTTRTVPKPTAFGKWVAASLLVISLGPPFVAAALDQGVAIGWGLPIAWKLVIGVVACLAPFGVIVGRALYLWSRSSQRGLGARSPTAVDATSNDASASNEEVSGWALLTGQAITEVQRDTTETPEPTSIEFEGYFRSLMREALPKGTTRRAVLVLDNLDRVDAATGLSIWSTLQTFLQDRSSQTEPWFERLWIIVPYDPDGLRRLWSGGGGALGKAPAQQQAELRESTAALDQAGEDSSSIATSASEQAGEDSGSIATSFIDKNFQVRFEIAPPIPSNWKAYLLDLVEQALPDHPGEDRHAVFRVFNYCCAGEVAAPTPRELKLYVNQIGVIHRQWQHEFPISHVAYYAALKRTEKSIRAGLLSGRLPSSTVAAIAGPKLKDSLAGLAYNVRSGLGLQFLLDGPIYDALVKGTPGNLRDLAEAHGDGFWLTLEALVGERLSDEEPKVLAQAVACLRESQVLDDHAGYEADTIVAGIRSVVDRVELWAPFDREMGEGIAQICRIVSDADLSQKIVSAVSRTLSGTQDLPEDYTEGLIEVWDAIGDLKQENVLPESFVFPGSADDWVLNAPVLEERAGGVVRSLKPNAQATDISKNLSQRVLSGGFDEGALAAVRVTQASQATPDWTSLVTSSETRLRADQTVPAAEAVLLLRAIALLRAYDCEEAGHALKRLSDEGHMLHRLHQAHTEGDPDCVAMCLVAFLEQRPAGDHPTAVGNSAAGHKILSDLLAGSDEPLAGKICSALRDDNRLGLLFEVADARGKFDQLLSDCLALVADSDTPEALFAPEVILERWSSLETALGVDSTGRYEQLIQGLCEKTELVAVVEGAEGGFRPDAARLYEVIVRKSGSVSFDEWSATGLKKLDESQWREQIQAEGPLFRLLCALIDKDVPVALSQPYQDAIVSHATSVLRGEIGTTDGQIDRREELMSPLTDAARKVTRQRLREAAIDRDGECADAFFELYGDELAAKETLMEKDEAVSMLFSPLVRKRKPGGLRWLLATMQNVPDLLDQYGESAAVEDFRERLQGECEKVEGEGSEEDQLVAELAALCGVESPVDKPDSE